MADEQLARQAYSCIVDAKVATYKAKQLLAQMVHQEQRAALVTGIERAYDDLDAVVEQIKRKVQIP